MLTNKDVAMQALRLGAKIVRDQWGRYKIHYRTTAVELTPTLFEQLKSASEIQKATQKLESFAEVWELAKPSTHAV